MCVIRNRNRPMSHGAKKTTERTGAAVASTVRVGEVVPW